MGTASGSIASEALFWPVGTTLFLYNNRNGILTHKLELGLEAETEVNHTPLLYLGGVLSCSQPIKSARGTSLLTAQQPAIGKVLMLDLWRTNMIITKERVCKAYGTMPSSYKYYERFEGTESKPVRIYYIMDWYQEFFKDISKEENEEIKGIVKTAFRRFTESDWDYVIRCSKGVYAKMAWNTKKQKYLNQLRQNKLFDEIIGYMGVLH